MNRITKLLALFLPVAAIALAPSAALAGVTFAGDYGPSNTTTWNGSTTGYIGTTGSSAMVNGWGSMEVTSSSSVTTASIRMGNMKGTSGSITMTDSYWNTTQTYFGGTVANGSATEMGTGYLRLTNTSVWATRFGHTASWGHNGSAYFDGCTFYTKYSAFGMNLDHAYIGAGGLTIRGDDWGGIPNQSYAAQNEWFSAFSEDLNSPGGGLTIGTRSDQRIYLSGANTYLGNTTMTTGTVSMKDGTNCSLLFDINDTSNNKIVVNNGAFGELLATLRLDLAGVTHGGVWTLVDTSPGGTAVYGPNFAMETTGGGLFETEDSTVWTYTSGDMQWSFNKSTGQLTCVPEPTTLALLACGLVGLLAYAWRKRK